MTELKPEQQFQLDRIRREIETIDSPPILRSEIIKLATTNYEMQNMYIQLIKKEWKLDSPQRLRPLRQLLVSIASYMRSLSNQIRNRK